jgi:hypothetical protein
VSLVKTDVSEERIASIIRVTRSGELGKTLAVISNERMLWFLQEPHGVTSQKTAFFIVTAVKTSTLTQRKHFSTQPCIVFEDGRIRSRAVHAVLLFNNHIAHV